MPKFSNIIIIFNPKSTGNSKAMAQELKKALASRLTDVEILTVPTEYAGHARKIASDTAIKNKRPLIISSSGDGGYNEVVNGFMDAGNPHATAAVLPAGNANDHSRTMQEQPLDEAIIKGVVTHIDLLRITVKADGQNATTRYAHSYAGLGLTPVVGRELNKHDLNKFNEIILSLKTFNKFEPFKIRHQGKDLRLDSLVFGNINQMAKVLTISPNNRPDDGLFEVVTFKHHGKLQLLKRLAKAAVSNLETTKRLKTYKFTTPKKIPMQLDGEIISLPAGSNVTIESAHKALATII